MTVEEIRYCSYIFQWYYLKIMNTEFANNAIGPYKIPRVLELFLPLTSAIPLVTIMPILYTRVKCSLLSHACLENYDVQYNRCQINYVMQQTTISY
jgi:hypothetical protein